MILLSPCVHALPSTHYGIADTDTRYRKRYLDLIVTTGVRDVFVKRAKALNSVRNFLGKLDFMEVETPVLSARAGGATARPFATHLNDLKLDMVMRVAPELHLKKLVVGGFPRVFEVARVFRNETMDATHNPEFTLIEFYMAYADYFDLMDMTEDMLRGLVHDVTGSHHLPYHPDGPEGEAISIDFESKFERIEMIPGLEKELGVEFPKDLSTDEARQWLDDLCVAKNVDCSAPRSTARLVDKLVGDFIEPKCINPTFIINHPVVMSPLAKVHRENPTLTERFELFVNGRELCNAYTELNDPVVQRERFEAQAQAKAEGDVEAQPIDDTFITALEHGLPPTAGWGMGFDRLCMLLNDKQTIRDVLLFPAMKPIGHPE